MSHSTSTTSNILAAYSITNHGTVLPAIFTGAMDVDQRPTASTDQGNLIDTTPENQLVHPEQEASSHISENLAPTPVLERPRQDGVPERTPLHRQNSPNQKGKTIPVTLPPTLFQASLG